MRLFRSELLLRWDCTLVSSFIPVLAYLIFRLTAPLFGSASLLRNYYDAPQRKPVFHHVFRSSSACMRRTKRRCQRRSRLGKSCTIVKLPALMTAPDRCGQFACVLFGTPNLKGGELMLCKLYVPNDVVYTSAQSLGFLSTFISSSSRVPDPSAPMSDMYSHRAVCGRL